MLPGIRPVKVSSRWTLEEKVALAAAIDKYREALELQGTAESLALAATLRPLYDELRKSPEELEANRKMFAEFLEN